MIVSRASLLRRIQETFQTAVALIFCLGFSLLSAQVQSPVNSGQQTSPSSPASVDYTRRELQPNLSTDRDPIPSPDVPLMNSSPNGKALESTGEGNNKIYTLHENVEEVLLNCTVVDEQGRLADNLKPGAFHIFEDGVPQTIVAFEHRDVPVSIGILVDNSGSMRDKRAAVDDAALDLVRHSNPKDAAFVVNFSDKAFLDQGFTSNVSDLERGLSHYDARGTTAIYDAIAASADEMSRYSKWPKQILLIITDGKDNASRTSLEQTIRRVQNLSGPVVYSIGLLYDASNKEDAKRARADLERLSKETGGIAYFPNSLDEVNGIANEVARAIRNQYTLGYHSTKPSNLGGYRSVHVDAVGPNGSKLNVITRKGYYPREIKQMHTEQISEKK
ncbi:MAG TPA: VWA domain-containing protein [Alloacidobacterium sp.]|nr:VWA domain-containing protein [Alloacidobacterium sp.]